MVLLLGCNFFNDNDSLEGLGLERHPYIGKELRTDGYYLATNTHKNMLGLIVLYRNGVCLCTYVENSGKSTKQYIEMMFCKINLTCIVYGVNPQPLVSL